MRGTSLCQNLFCQNKDGFEEDNCSTDCVDYMVDYTPVNGDNLCCSYCGEVIDVYADSEWTDDGNISLFERDGLPYKIKCTNCDKTNTIGAHQEVYYEVFKSSR